MTFATDAPRGAWWKQLSDHIHARTGRQLKRLQIRMSAGRIMIAGRVPSEEVKKQAEDAAREVVPEHCLGLFLRIEGGDEAPETTAQSDLANNPKARYFSCLGTELYRRLHCLVHGN